LGPRLSPDCVGTYTCRPVDGIGSVSKQISIIPEREAIPGCAGQHNRCFYLRSQLRGHCEDDARARDAYRNRVLQGRPTCQLWPPIHEYSAERRSVPERVREELCPSRLPWSQRESLRVCRIVSVEWEVPAEYTARSRWVGKGVERASDIDGKG